MWTASGAASLGLLTAGRPRFLACTPAGVMAILARNGIAVAGKHVVIAGRSNIVGKPLALMLLAKGADATVTVCTAGRGTWARSCARRTSW